MHRGAFWREIAKHIPDGVIEMGKKLKNIELSQNDQTGPLVLTFDDGTTYEADALVGCDGINSITRQTVLQDHPSAKPIYGKGYGHRTVVPMEVARSVFGEDYCKIRSQHGWIGHNALLITDMIDEGGSMECIIGGLELKETWPYDSPWVPWSKETLAENLKDWGTFGKSMLKVSHWKLESAIGCSVCSNSSQVFQDQGELYAAGSRIHLETPTFYRGSVCLAGDAAQTFPPTQAAGTRDDYLHFCLTCTDIVSRYWPGH